MRISRAWLALAVAFSVITCDTFPTFPSQPSAVSASGSASLDGTVGGTVQASVSVLDAQGSPVVNFPVTFAVEPGIGSVVSPKPTGADGVATTTWTLGTKAGTAQKMTATAGPRTFVFTATGKPAVPSRIAVDPGTRTGFANNVLSPALTLHLEDGFQNVAPVAGVPINFSVSGGGSLAASSAMTNTSGVVTVPAWTLGTATSLPQTLTATGTGLGTTTVDVTVQADPNTARTIAINAGNGQTDTIGATLRIRPSVIVKDASGNLLPNVTVTFAVTAGAGSVAGGTATTDNFGIATVGNWTLGTTSGTNNNSLTATTANAGTSVIFTASATPGVAFSIAKNAGDNQTAGPAAAVATPPSVIVRDKFQNPVAGTVVNFAAAPGSGTVTPASVTTGANGIAAVTSWTLGTVVGVTNTLTATSGTLSGSPLAFTATVGTPTGGAIAKNVGDNQSAVVNTVVAVAPSIVLKDSFGNPISGVGVTFTVTGGGGSVTGASQTTDAGGVATVTSWKLGTLVGPNTLVATTPNNGSVTFAATGTVGIASNLAAATPLTIPGVVSTPVTPPPGVRVTDAFGNSVSGVAVTFAAGTGTTATGTSVTTNTLGVATVGSWTLGSTVGAYTLTATSGSLAGSPVTFTANAGPDLGLMTYTGGVLSAVVGHAVTPPSIIIKDSHNNAIQGAAVTFTVASGGGSIVSGSTTTNASGIATLGSWTLGIVAGTNTLTVTAAAGGLPVNGSPLTISATGIPDAPSTMQLVAGNAQSANAGTSVGASPSVRVRDQFGNAVSGTPVTFVVTAGGGVLAGATTTTDANGIATLASWTLGTTAGPNSVSASSADPGLAGITINFTATGTVGPAANIAVNSGNGGTAVAGTTLATPPSVIIKDAFGNPVPNVSVTFATSSGSLSGASPTTNASGIATVGSWTLRTTAGPNTMTATSGSLAGSPVTFTATGTAGAAAKLDPNGGTSQTAVAGSAATPPSVIVRDANNNPVSGISVIFAITGGGGSATGLAPTTNASGIATAGSWTLGLTAGANSMTATSAGLTGSPVTFTATGTTPPATTIAANGGSGQTATVGTTVVTAPSVKVTDVNGNPVAGVNVTFAVATGGGSATGLPATTNASGIATVGSWTLGTTAGANTLTATVAGLAGSPVTFSATGVAGPAANISVNAGSGQTAVAGTNVATAPSVKVTDANGNPVAGISVTFAVGTGGGSATGLPAITNASGIATVGSWTLGPVAGPNTLTATSGALAGSPVTFTATGS